MDDVRIVAAAEAHVESFHRCLDQVARERRYLGFLAAPPLEDTRAYLRSLRDGSGLQVVAVDDANDVVGWCDVVSGSREGFRHSWRLGMGLLPDVRGRGIGERLARAAIDAAIERGAERIELEVFRSNSRAIALYERLGFQHEGVRRRARKLDGQYDDDVLMAMLIGPAHRA
jgi:RimJ/RimL family protein N-acetyltransferase